MVEENNWGGIDGLVLGKQSPFPLPEPTLALNELPSPHPAHAVAATITIVSLVSFIAAAVNSN